MPIVTKQKPVARRVAPVPIPQKPASTVTGGGDREVIYPEPEARLFLGEEALTQEMAKQLLGWETQVAYTARMLQESPNIKPETAIYSDDLVDFVDGDGQKVHCWNNTRNRPFKETHAKQLAQDILNKQWAFNFENIIIGKYGQVVSGQHRLIGLVFACQIWGGKQKAHWQSIWTEGEPTIEVSIGFGIDEDPRVLQTLDNVMPRDFSDVLYTSEVFADLGNVEKKECSRMLAKGTQLLWKRTGEGERADSFNHFQTHSTSKSFLDRHAKLIQTVMTIFDLNKERAISVLKLSPGQCAGMLYLMGCSNSDVNDYRNKGCEESLLSWDNWEEACAFWKALAESDGTYPVRRGLGALVDEDTGVSGRLLEKIAVLAKAWTAYATNAGEITDEDVTLQYTEPDADGMVHLAGDIPDFGGIDIGEKKREEAKDDPEEMEKEKEAVRQERAQKLLKQAEKPAVLAPPVVKPLTRKEVEAEQTKKAKEADAKPSIQAVSLPKPNGKPAPVGRKK